MIQWSECAVPSKPNDWNTDNSFSVYFQLTLYIFYLATAIGLDYFKRSNNDDEL